MDDRTKARTRTVSWKDPVTSVEAARKLSGLEHLRRIRDGMTPNPPIAELLGFSLTKVELGEAVFEFDPAEYHYNPVGTVHGGVAATLLDSAMTCAVQTTCPAGTLCTTLEFKINFVRPIVEKTGHLRAEAKLIHGGSRIATAEARLVDGDGKIYAHATTTCLIFS